MYIVYPRNLIRSITGLLKGNIFVPSFCNMLFYIDLWTIMKPCRYTLHCMHWVCKEKIAETVPVYLQTLFLSFCRRTKTLMRSVMNNQVMRRRVWRPTQP